MRTPFWQVFLMGVFTEKLIAINKPSSLHDCCDVCEHKCVCDVYNVSILNTNLGIRDIGHSYLLEDDELLMNPAHKTAKF